MILTTIPTLAFALLFTAASEATRADSLRVPPAAAQGDTIRADAQVRASVLRNTADVRRCYESEGLPRNPMLRGTIEIALTIEPTGVVSSARVGSLRIGGPGVAELAICIVRHARNWRFDRGPYSVEVHLFPFSFVPELASPITGGSRIGS